MELGGCWSTGGPLGVAGWPAPSDIFFVIARAESRGSPCLPHSLADNACVAWRERSPRRCLLAHSSRQGRAILPTLAISGATPTLEARKRAILPTLAIRGATPTLEARARNSDARNRRPKLGSSGFLGRLALSGRRCRLVRCGDAPRGRNVRAWAGGPCWRTQEPALSHHGQASVCPDAAVGRPMGSACGDTVVLDSRNSDAG